MIKETDEIINTNTEFFHLNILDLAKNEDMSNANLTFHIGSKKYPISAHTPETLSRAKGSNKAISLIPTDYLHKISHFAEVPLKDLPDDHICLLKVTSTNQDTSVPLPDLLLLSFYIPREIRLKHFRAKLNSPRSDEISCASSKLKHFGVDLIDSDLREAVLVDEENILTPRDAAIAVLFHHQELGSTNPDTASSIKYNHICNPNNESSLNEFATAISAQGKGKWARVSTVIGPDGKVACYEYDVKDENGNLLHEKGSPIYHYKLSEKTLEAAQRPLGNSLKTSKDDINLQNKKWSVSAGLCASSYEQETPPSEARNYVDRDNQGWTIEDRTHHYGIYVYQDSIKIGEDDTFSVNLRNIFLRSLGAYAQFFDDNGNLISIDGDLTSFPNFLRSCIQPNPEKKYVDSISAVNTIMGVPAPVFADTISFKFPRNAASVNLMFGGFGTSNWDWDVLFPGIITTAIFQYGIPGIFLAAGTWLESTKIFKDIMKDKELLFGLISAGAFLVAGIEAARAATGDTKIVISSALTQLADFILKILYSTGLEKLLAWVVGKITAAELENAIPLVGWGYAVASIVISAAQLAETTIECLASPAKIDVKIKRQMSLQLTLNPDPTHGEVGRKPIWPSTSDHYQVTVIYIGGTKFVNKGPMYKTTSDKSLIIDFNEIPKGGSLKIISGIYSLNDSLVGKWESEWIAAFPKEDNILKVTGNIKEILVPLTKDTKYSYKEKIEYEDQKHAWVAGKRPQATAANLDCSNVGKHLCKLVSLTINNKAYQIGYCWRASNLGLPTCGSSQIENGQAFVFQNISILADPDSGFKFPNCSLSNQPAIAYDLFGQGVALNRNFYLELNNGAYHLRQIDLSDPSKVIDLQAPDKKSWGRFSQDHLDSMIVHPDGYVIAVSWMHHKMEILKIPEAPSDDDKAVESQLVSGEGVREGLMNGPIALNVTPDGRVILLESINKRIQAFDIKGNPVPSFDGEFLCNLSKDIQSDLDKGIFSEELQKSFQMFGLTHLCDLDSSLREDLNKGVVSELAKQFYKNGLYLSYDKDKPRDPEISSHIEIKARDQKWMIMDPFGRTYDALADGSMIGIYEHLDKSNVTIKVRSENKKWVITDTYKGKAYTVKREGDDLKLYEYLSTMQLHDSEKSEAISYLDLSTESKGYIYVLSIKGNDESNISNYLLDIYEPNGSFLNRTEGVNAARIAVNLWRDLYTLNYEMISGPGGRPEPSISHWIPDNKS